MQLAYPIQLFDTENICRILLRKFLQSRADVHVLLVVLVIEQQILNGSLHVFFILVIVRLHQRDNLV